MSWEVICDKVKKCECGKGKTRYVSEMDDWNNSRSREYIDCKECYDKYLEYQRKANECMNTAKHNNTNYIYVNKINESHQ